MYTCKPAETDDRSLLKRTSSIKYLHFVFHFSFSFPSPIKHKQWNYMSVIFMKRTAMVQRQLYLLYLLAEIKWYWPLVQVFNATISKGLQFHLTKAGTIWKTIMAVQALYNTGIYQLAASMTTGSSPWVSWSQENIGW